MASLTRTLSSVKFFTFGIGNKPVLQPACSILRSLNQNLLTVNDIDTSFERLHVALNALT